MDLETAADDLYGAAPDAFTPRRAELAGQARRDGDARMAALITSLRRPTVAAWAVNMLVRQRPEDVEELLGVAEALRSAQRALDAERMRELGARRRRTVAALTAVARELAAAARKPLSDAVAREVEATLDAAVADENAEVAVRTGRLTAALTYSGFGQVDISAAVAAADARPRLRVVAAEAKSARPSGSERAAVERERRRVEASAALAEATSRRDALLAESEQVRRRVEEIERELRPVESLVRAAQRRLDALGD